MVIENGAKSDVTGVNNHSSINEAQKDVAYHKLAQRYIGGPTFYPITSPLDNHYHKSRP